MAFYLCVALAPLEPSISLNLYLPGTCTLNLLLHLHLHLNLHLHSTYTPSLDWSTPPPPEEALTSEAEAPQVHPHLLPGLPEENSDVHPNSPQLTLTHLSDLTPAHLTSPPQGTSALPSWPNRTVVAPPSPSPSTCLTSHLSTGTLAAG